MVRLFHAQVAVVNLGEAKTDFDLTWEVIRLNKPAWHRAQVRDLWLHEDVGMFAGSYTVKGLESHATMLLIVKETA